MAVEGISSHFCPLLHSVVLNYIPLSRGKIVAPDQVTCLQDFSTLSATGNTDVPTAKQILYRYRICSPQLPFLYAHVFNSCSHVCVGSGPVDSQKSKSDRLSNQKVVTQKRHNFSSRQVQAIECARGEVALGDGRFQTISVQRLEGFGVDAEKDTGEHSE
ncbi:hypothetical protein Anapl_08746 [Anas platyrhynchos]|uniref:Uncharacterized protein n=1 Tax=Anas platyrhynchos TaxID=8839 RepID=R0L3T9_ANAPL|nr:hypothetical protein Anapl_08746 [Anas platyrhynchos]